MKLYKCSYTLSSEHEPIECLVPANNRNSAKVMFFNLLDDSWIECDYIDIRAKKASDDEIQEYNAHFGTGYTK